MRRSRAPSRAARPRSETDCIPAATPGDRVGFGELSQEDKARNASATLDGSVAVVRAPILPFLSVPKTLFKQFKSPCPNRDEASNSLLKRKTLGVNRRRMNFITKPFVPVSRMTPLEVEVGEDVASIDVSEGIESRSERESEEEATWEPLVLYDGEAMGEGDDDEGHVHVEVEGVLCKWLRPHQREGVRFMFECVAGLRDFDGNGCILADDMGLGKTLQAITLLYTLLRQSVRRPGQPDARRVIIVSPTSLVKNWEQEVSKWLGDRVKCIALSEASRDKVISGMTTFLTSRAFPVLIVSYETFRMHVSRFDRPDACDLLICDEAHRLKNDETLTNKALASLSCRRRVLLSGTPMQNDLEEFFAMVNFTNPDLLGTVSQFRRKFQQPILTGREPDATDKERALGERRSHELAGLVNEFILRRTNTVLSEHLPPKTVSIVCCRMSPLQRKLYNHFLHSKAVQGAIEGKQVRVLSLITALKKLCNHPKLIWDAIVAKTGQEVQGAPGFENCEALFPEHFFSRGRSRSRSVHAELSGKLDCLDRLMTNVRMHTSDKIVLISNYTQTLDVFGDLCRERSYKFVRLDGTTTASKRQKLVDQFNDDSNGFFAFLLSSKAGGCGLNLVGANRLVLFDPDWNPANDKQAAARVWRDGQKKRVFLYRFLTAGTLEEKVYQRQLSKEGLQSIVVDNKSESNSLSSEDLRDLFTLRPDCTSDTHDQLLCRRCTAPDSEVAAVIARYRVRNKQYPEVELAHANRRRRAEEQAEEADEDFDPAVGLKEDENDVKEIGVKEESGVKEEEEEGEAATSREDGDKGEAKDEGFEEEEEDDDDDEEGGDAYGVVLANPEDAKDGSEEAMTEEELAMVERLKQCKPQIGNPLEEDLKRWAHHFGTSHCRDVCLRDANADGLVSFVFSLQIQGRPLDVADTAFEDGLRPEDATEPDPYEADEKAAIEATERRREEWRRKAAEAAAEHDAEIEEEEEEEEEEKKVAAEDAADGQDLASDEDEAALSETESEGGDPASKSRRRPATRRTSSRRSAPDSRTRQSPPRRQQRRAATQQRRRVMESEDDEDGEEGKEGEAAGQAAAAEAAGEQQASPEAPSPDKEQSGDAASHSSRKRGRDDSGNDAAAPAAGGVEEEEEDDEDEEAAVAKRQRVSATTANGGRTGRKVIEESDSSDSSSSSDDEEDYGDDDSDDENEVEGAQGKGGAKQVHVGHSMGTNRTDAPAAAAGDSGVAQEAAPSAPRGDEEHEEDEEGGPARNGFGAPVVQPGTSSVAGAVGERAGGDDAAVESSESNEDDDFAGVPRLRKKVAGMGVSATSPDRRRGRRRAPPSPPSLSVGQRSSTKSAKSAKKGKRAVDPALGIDESNCTEEEAIAAALAAVAAAEGGGSESGAAGSAEEAAADERQGTEAAPSAAPGQGEGERGSEGFGAQQGAESPLRDPEQENAVGAEGWATPAGGGHASTPAAPKSSSVASGGTLASTATGRKRRRNLRLRGAPDADESWPATTAQL